MFKKIALAATLSILASSASARGISAWYAGADLGRTDHHSFSDSGSSMGAFLGVRINRVLSLEGSYRRLGSFDTADGATNVKLHQYAFSAIGTAPLASRVNLYGRFGLNVHLDNQPTYGTPEHHSYNDVAFVVGAGLTYAFSPTISGRVELQSASSDVSNFNAGIVFKF